MKRMTISKIQSIFARGIDVAYPVQLKISETGDVLNVTSSWFRIDIMAVVPDTMLCSWLQLATPTAALTLLTMWLDYGKWVISKISNAELPIGLS